MPIQNGRQRKLLATTILFATLFFTGCSFAVVPQTWPAIMVAMVLVFAAACGNGTTSTSTDDDDDDLTGCGPRQTIVEIFDNDVDNCIGFRITLSGDNGLGRSVAPAGDINGDGFDDILIGLSRRDLSNEGRGSAVVLKGKAGPFSDISLDSLSSGDGFRIDGQDEAVYVYEGGAYYWEWDQDQRFGRALAGGTDFNGDGFADMIFGSHLTRWGYYYEWTGEGAFTEGYDNYDNGRGYILFGRETDFSHPLPFTSFDFGEGGGLVVRGNQEDGLFGFSAASSWDMNGDGFAEALFGSHSYQTQAEGTYHGLAWIARGTDSHTGGFESGDIGGEGLPGNRISHPGNSGYGFGFALAGSGDVNGDGYADIAVSNPWLHIEGDNSGRAYVVTGSPVMNDNNNRVPSIALSADGYGWYLGHSVAFADVNGDGYSDLIVGVPAFGVEGEGSEGIVAVRFGYSGYSEGFPYNQSLGSLNGSNGFMLFGSAANDGTGRSVAGIGDFNGDGFDDILIGAPFADPTTGDIEGINSAGKAYIVFGKADWTADGGTMSLSTLNGMNGITVSGTLAGSMLGYSVAAGGDINGDGFADVLIGSLGYYGDGKQVLVLFGGDVTGSVTAEGTAAGDTLSVSGGGAAVGGRGNDIITATGEGNTLIGGAGHDLFEVSEPYFQKVDGGSGFDVLRFTQSGYTIRTGKGWWSNNRNAGLDIRNIEAIDLGGTGEGNALQLSRGAISLMSTTSSSLYILGGTNDYACTYGTSWSMGDGQSIDIGGDTIQFGRRDHDGLSLFIQEGMTFSDSCD